MNFCSVLKFSIQRHLSKKCKGSMSQLHFLSTSKINLEIKLKKIKIRVGNLQKFVERIGTLCWQPATARRVIVSMFKRAVIYMRELVGR